MNFDTLWQTFTDTGDPMGYLLFKAAESAEPPAEAKKRDGDELPRPVD